MASRTHLAALFLAGCASGLRYAKEQIADHVFARPDGEERSGRRNGGMRGGHRGQGSAASTPGKRYEVDGLAVDPGHSQVHIVRQVVTDDGIDSEEAVELEWKLIDALEPAQAAALVTW